MSIRLSGKHIGNCLYVLLALTATVISLPAFAAPSDNDPDVVIADFNAPTYSPGWVTTGTAFGSGPAAGALGSQNIVSGFEGSGLVNSYLGGDDPTGTLTSPPFTLSRRYLRFLVGGGNRPSDEYVALLIGGKSVKTVTGGNSEHLGPVQWDLADYKGQQAVLQIVDSGGGGWGHILVDDFVLTDQGPPLFDAGLVPAMTAMTAAAISASGDAARPVYHFHAPAQWMNDPNGLIYYDGWYQLFYQSNPYASGWGNIHWGHARSRDLINWEQLPIALAPSVNRGEAYVYSGSIAVDSQGRLLAFYTSIPTNLAPRDPEIWVAQPTDKSLLYWQKLDTEPVISEATNGAVHVDEWRDPFVVTDKGITYLITGGELAGKGVVCLYQAADSKLAQWTYRGTLFQYPGGSVRNIECPNLFKVGSKWVLLLSVNNQIEYYIGDADLAQCTFTQDQHGVLESGSYASQVTADAQGNPVEIAWVRPIGGPGWAGCLTLPNSVSIDNDGTLLLNPASSVDTLAAKPLSVPLGPLTGKQPLPVSASGNTLAITLEILPGTATAVGLSLKESADGERGIDVHYDVSSNVLSVPGLPSIHVPLDKANGALHLQLYLDRSLLDIYGDNGRVAVTGVPASTSDATDLGVGVYAQGGTAQLKSLTVSLMKPAAFDMTNFHL